MATTTLPPLVQALSGGTGSAVANLAIYPLDVLSTRLQTSESKGKHTRRQPSTPLLLKHLLDTEGLSGLYAGVAADTLSSLSSHTLYFFLYSFLRRQSLRRSPRSKAPSAAEEIAIGFLAGVGSKAVTLPLSNVVVVQQNENGSGGEGKRKGMREVARDIVKRRGILGLWAGLPATLPLTLHPSLSLYLFTLLIRLTLPRARRAKPRAAEVFLASASGSALATLLLYPLMLAKTRLQAGTGKSGGLVQGLREVYARDGAAGLYRGMEPQLIKGALNQGLTILVKQRIELGVIALYWMLRRQRAAKAA